VNGIFQVTDEGTFRVALVGDLGWFHLEQSRHRANCAGRLLRDMRAYDQRPTPLRRPRDEVTQRFIRRGMKRSNRQISKGSLSSGYSLE
jgi:hypothetical protein